MEFKMYTYAHSDTERETIVVDLPDECSMIITVNSYDDEKSVWKDAFTVLGKKEAIALGNILITMAESLDD